LLSTFVRSLTLDAPARALPQRQAETPDFLLTANWGFNFNSGTELHSDHGGLFAEETRNTFVLSRIGSRAFSRRYQARGPVLIKDLTPTLLEIAGRKADTGISGQSLKSIAESLVLEMNQRDPASKRAPKPTPMPFEELD
jgi:arylsulfatase A-like enzyme